MIITTSNYSKHGTFAIMLCILYVITMANYWKIYNYVECGSDMRKKSKTCLQQDQWPKLLQMAYRPTIITRNEIFKYCQVHLRLTSGKNDNVMTPLCRETSGKEIILVNLHNFA